MTMMCYAYSCVSYYGSCFSFYLKVMWVDARIIVIPKWKIDTKKVDILNEIVEQMYWDSISIEKYSPHPLENKDDVEYIEYNTMSRYYWPSYRRWRFPKIYSVFMLMRASFDWKIVYCWDGDDYESIYWLPETTIDEMNEILDDYLSHYEQ